VNEAAAERAALVEHFAGFPTRLADAARAAAARPVVAGEWTPTQVVSHLIAVEDVVWRARLRDLGTTDEPRWSRTEPGLAAGLADATLDDVLSAFGASRTGTAEIVRALDDADWSRQGVHEVYGRLDVAALLGIAIDHDEEHLQSLPVD
jgi:hypothetical protein